MFATLVDCVLTSSNVPYGRRSLGLLALLGRKALICKYRVGSPRRALASCNDSGVADILQRKGLDGQTVAQIYWPLGYNVKALLGPISVPVLWVHLRFLSL